MVSTARPISDDVPQVSSLLPVFYGRHTLTIFLSARARRSRYTTTTPRTSPHRSVLSVIDQGCLYTLPAGWMNRGFVSMLPRSRPSHCHETAAATATDAAGADYRVITHVEIPGSHYQPPPHYRPACPDCDRPSGAARALLSPVLLS